MDSSYIDPVKQYEYQQLVDKSKRVTRNNSKDEFLDIILEQIYLNKILNTNKFVDEQDESNEEDSGDIINLGNNKMMDIYTKSNIISQIAENDTFGLRDAFKKRGFVDDK